MVERRDACCSQSQQYLSVRDSWFGMIDELQPFVTGELFRSHCAHFSSPVQLVARLCGPPSVLLSTTASHRSSSGLVSQARRVLYPRRPLDYCYNPLRRIRCVILIWLQVFLGGPMGHSKAEKAETHK